MVRDTNKLSGREFKLFEEWSFKGSEKEKTKGSGFRTGISSSKKQVVEKFGSSVHP